MSQASRYFSNHGLFTDSYLDRILRDPHVPFQRKLPEDGDTRLRRLVQHWKDNRPLLVREIKGGVPKNRPIFSGLPEHLAPMSGSESNVENQFIQPIVREILSYHVLQNQSLQLQGPAAAEVKNAKGTQRPDMVLFYKPEAWQVAAQVVNENKAANAVEVCREAQFVLDAKKFSKGIGADDLVDDVDRLKPKRERKERSAIEDLHQVERYLRGSGKKWGILTNGRSWLLMRAGNRDAYVRFDMVLWLEGFLARPSPMQITDDDRDIFSLFWFFFGPPAVASGFLDKVEAEATANVRAVREVLRENVHEAVREISAGFLFNPNNDFSLPPRQSQLDHLRELSLTFLYRLLFILKAEAQNLLPMTDALGAETNYAKTLSTKAIFSHLKMCDPTVRKSSETIFRQNLRDLFTAVDKGEKLSHVPAFNGGLFDPERNQELVNLRMLDESLYMVLKKLIYQDAEQEPVPYADLDVRDLGDIYEGLLEQRLSYISGDKPRMELRGEKSGKKASGSYFTPDRLVEHVTRGVLKPLLGKCGDDAEKILALRVLDPAMGSGHFLVKAVDVISEYLTINCVPPVLEAPNDNGPIERAYWRARVVENCIYGVDCNPMAVELAKVALWLHCARGDKPLSFLDHHLKTGNSLVGASLECLASPGLRLKVGKRGGEWVAVPKLAEEAAGMFPPKEVVPAKKAGRKKKDSTQQLSLPFPIDTNLFSGILTSVRSVLKRPSDKPEDIREKRREYARVVENRLMAHRLLADLWCAQWFFASPDDVGKKAYEDGIGHVSLFNQVKAICGEPDDVRRETEMAKVLGHPMVERIRQERNQGYGPRPYAFFHWQLEFPEVAFDEHGKLREGFGFDAVIGNPPWDKIKPAKRDFFTPFDVEIANSQGAGLDRKVAALIAGRPELKDGWEQYEKTLNDTVFYLASSGTYSHQSVEVNGKKTGGDPDLFRYFVERGFQAAGRGGRIGLVTPSTLWQGEGCTGLRRLLLQKTRLDSLFVFENYRKWAFGIDSRFKFSTVVTCKEPPLVNHEFSAGFMLRNTRILDGNAQNRLIRLSLEKVQAISPDALALLDFKTNADSDVVSRLHQNFPMLGAEASGWGVTYRREVDMTNDSWLFKSPEWMKERGFALVRPVRQNNGAWKQVVMYKPESSKLPISLPLGGEYWVAADELFYQNRGYEKIEVDLPGGKTTCYIHPIDLELAHSGSYRWKVPAAWHFRIIPNSIYSALYEGRMVGNYDYAKKAFVRGEGRQAIWVEKSFSEKSLQSRVFVCVKENLELGKRIGFGEITGATNERTMQAALLPTSSVCGNKVPVLNSEQFVSEGLGCLLNSFVVDTLLRFRVTTTLNWIYVRRIVVPNWGTIPSLVRREVSESVVRLSCLTPETTEYWNEVFPDRPWSYDCAERDLAKRGELRAELDAIVAELYGLSVPEYARLLSGFPLLDRDQPPLPGDSFLTEAGEAVSASSPGRNETWVEVDGEYFEIKPRSFVTRDAALLSYIRRKKYPIPQDLEKWFRDEVQLDPNGPLSRFRVGEVKDLEDRVVRARKLGAIPYIPTGSADAESPTDLGESENDAGADS